MRESNGRARLPMKILNDGIPIIARKECSERHIDFREVHYANQSEFGAVARRP